MVHGAIVMIDGGTTIDLVDYVSDDESSLTHYCRTMGFI